MNPPDARYQLLHGDCREVLTSLDDMSVHAVVTDPPYHLVRHGRRKRASAAGFMGKRWDGGSVAFDRTTWEQAYRVLKPGGHLLAFGSPRTSHRMVCAIEDAGFEVIDTILWIYGDGYPKSKNLAGEHDGKGTALKPSFEPITLARRPLDGTVLGNVQKHEGCGVLNIRACEVPVGQEAVRRDGAGPSRVRTSATRRRAAPTSP